MKINKLIIAIALLFIYGGAFAQHNHEHHHHDLEHHHDLGYIEGTVYEEIEGKKVALPGVNVYWKIVNEGTVTDADGHYKIPVHEKSIAWFSVSWLTTTIPFTKWTSPCTTTM